jgi:hypothetical protein
MIEGQQIAERKAQLSRTEAKPQEPQAFQKRKWRLRGVQLQKAPPLQEEKIPLLWQPQFC